MAPFGCPGDRLVDTGGAIRAVAGGAPGQSTPDQGNERERLNYLAASHKRGTFISQRQDSTLRSTPSDEN